MSNKKRIKELEQKRQEIFEFTNQLDEQLSNKEIDNMEHLLLLNEQYPDKTKEELLGEIKQELSGLQSHADNHRREKIRLGMVAGIVIALVLLSIVLKYPLEGITGFTVGTKEVTEIIDYNEVFESYTETQLNITNITSLKISGVLEGTKATVKLRANDGTEYLVADIVNEEPTDLITGMVVGEEQEPSHILSTDKEIYSLGKTVVLTVEPIPDDYSLYIAFAEETHKLEGDSYVTENLGEHQAIALVVLPEDILKLETNFTVVNESVNETVEEIVNETETNETQANTPAATSNVFEDVCVDTCNLPETSYPVLIIELEGESKLTITEIITVQSKENKAPKQTEKIPDITITLAQTATLDLDEYYTDPDGDVIHYDLVDIPEINVDVTGSSMEISSETPGTYTAFIYATDGDKLETSNTFEIIVLETNAINESTNETNETVIITPPDKPLTEVKDPCKHPDPNKRPLACIEGREEEYFEMESVFLKNEKRSPAARITPIGNLIITGNLFENSVMNPGLNDFKVTVTNADLEDEPVAWIDSDTGDLHLKGDLYEEDFFLTPTPGAFVIQNQRNVNLAYIDRRTGDLHVKGNLIQNRESIE